MRVASRSITKPNKNCQVQEEIRECLVDLGSECSIIRESVARHFKLRIKETTKTLTGFNRAVVIPLGYAKMNIHIDGIMFKIKVFIVRHSELAKEIIIGRDVLKREGSVALSDASGVTFTVRDTGRNEISREVNMVVEETLKPIERSEINNGLPDPELMTRLWKLLNKSIRG